MPLPKTQYQALNLERTSQTFGFNFIWTYKWYINSDGLNSVVLSQPACLIVNLIETVYRTSHRYNADLSDRTVKRQLFFLSFVQNGCQLQLTPRFWLIIWYFTLPTYETTKHGREPSLTNGGTLYNFSLVHFVFLMNVCSWFCNHSIQINQNNQLICSQIWPPYAYAIWDYRQSLIGQFWP